jgi:hypothetical protein
MKSDMQAHADIHNHIFNVWKQCLATTNTVKNLMEYSDIIYQN